MRRSLTIVVLTFVLLVVAAAAGAVVFNQELMRGAGPAFGAAGPTPTPPFARFTAADVVQAFRNFGLETEDAHPLSAENFKAFYGDVPLGKGQVAAFLDQPSGHTLGHILVFDNPTDEDATLQYLQGHESPVVIYRKTQIRNANLILVMYVYYKDSPDLSAYNAAFIGLR
jgi:hypothetical protein